MLSRLAAGRRVCRAWAGALLALLLAGCSSFRPWHNPLPAAPSPPHAVSPGQGRSMVVAVTLSGGGSRAAAFGLGVLKALKDTRLHWDGRDTTLLDEVGFVGGVSGGSILAAHYAAFGDATLERFEPDFLDLDVQASLWASALLPPRVARLTSPWYGRSHVLADALDRLYQGRRLGDVADRPGAPELVISATDLRLGSAFEFSAEQLSAMCIDWRSVPLSFAVASSAAVPLLLTPTTLRNHAGRCAPAAPADAAAPADFRTHLRAATAASYLDAQARPHIHLVDGGIADNLGLRGLIDRFVAEGSIRQPFADAPPGSIRRLVLVVVNAEREVDDGVESSDRVPSTTQVLHTLVYGAGSRETQVTLALLRQDAQRWAEELASERLRPHSPFAADAELHVVVVNLQALTEAEWHRRLLRVPTSLALDADDVRDLQAGGRDALCRSAAFAALVRSVGAAVPAGCPELPRR